MFHKFCLRKCRLNLYSTGSQQTTDGIVTATGCLPRSCASISRSGRIFILFFKASIPIRESIQPPVQWCQGSSYGEKRPVNVADGSPPSSSRHKNGWNCTSVPPYAFLAFTELVYFHLFYC